MLKPVLLTVFVPAGLKAAKQDKDFWQRSTHQTIPVIDICTCSGFDMSYCITIYIPCRDCIGIVLAPRIVYALNSPPVQFDPQMWQWENIDPLTANQSFNLSCFDRFWSKCWDRHIWMSYKAQEGAFKARPCVIVNPDPEGGLCRL